MLETRVLLRRTTDAGLLTVFEMMNASGSRKAVMKAVQRLGRFEDGIKNRGAGKKGDAVWSS